MVRLNRKLNKIIDWRRLTAACGLLLLAQTVTAQINYSELENDAALRSVSERKMDRALIRRLSQRYGSGPVDLIVEYRQQPLAAGTPSDRSLALQQLKAQIEARFNTPAFEKRHRYRQLPMDAIRISDTQTLRQLINDQSIEAIYFDEPLQYHLNQSLPLIAQTEALNIGFSGQQTTVVVLDSGTDHTLSDFGNCTSPGVPESCRVIVNFDIAADDGVLDDNGHGTNVAAIVAGVASNVQIASLDVGGAGGIISSSDVIAGIDWAISNRDVYNIAAINMSLGSSNTFTSPCSFGNPYRSAIDNARNAGLVVVASSGNDGESNGIASPACTPGVISVGAVYDAAGGSISWGSPVTCTDSSRVADQITCFTNSDTFLSMLAPGALITAGGNTYGGTSQAAPHVAGAAAVLKSAYPTQSVTELEAKLLTSSTQITDSRNGVTSPRLDLLEALGAVNDIFAAALSVTDGVRISNTTAGAELGEPNHAGVAGGASLWWRWQSTVIENVCLNTVGSNVDTLLGVYTGVSVDALVEITSNDNANGQSTSEVCFVAEAGQLYFIAVDSVDGVEGIIQLNADVSEYVEELEEDIPLLPHWAMILLIAMLIRVYGRSR